ncbi:MAG: hypothetical protein AAGU74_12755 [Bacillota bacterium]
MEQTVTLSDIEAMDREFLRAVDVAPVLGIDPQDIRGQAQNDASKLGFPVIVTGSRVRIPKEGFLYYCRYGRPVQLEAPSDP